jgi:GDPmannose 4,6-dehydratase
MSDRALITGVTGQDGSYLAQLLAAKGYAVYGLVRPADRDAPQRLAELCPDLQCVTGDLTDESSLRRALEVSQPGEVYNLGGVTSPANSFEQALRTGDVTGLGAVRMLESIRTVNPDIRFFQASSSEVFGNAITSPQDELTPFHPRSPYGAAKAYAHNITVNFREQFGMFACNGILYNHESPRRGLHFVTRKITDGAARISVGLQEQLALGDLDAVRDWGFAGDYVAAMHLMLQAPVPDDFVVATGQPHTVREVCALAFGRLGLDYQRHVVTDARFLRQPDPVPLIGDATKARLVLGWQPQTSFDEMVAAMVDNDLAEIQRAAS